LVSGATDYNFTNPTSTGAFTAQNSSNNIAFVATGGSSRTYPQYANSNFTLVVQKKY
jgi:hypothetical protein